MLKDYQINIFARVVIRRNKEENKSYDEILETHPLLTPEDKKAIKEKISHIGGNQVE